MITDTHVSEYINSLGPDLPDYLYELEKYAQQHYVPIIRKEAQNLLCFLLDERQPSKVLEVGTAIGFSAQLMAEALPKTSHITTIEKVEMRLVEARKNLKASPNRDMITLIEGDALQVLKELEGPYDFIFLDAAKAQYMNFLPELLRMLSPDGCLVTDNVLQEGSLAGSKFAVPRRDRTIHMRMREYLYEITHREDIKTVILPVGDGMAISTRRKMEKK